MKLLGKDRNNVILSVYSIRRVYVVLYTLLWNIKKYVILPYDTLLLNLNSNKEWMQSLLYYYVGTIRNAYILSNSQIINN